MSTVEEALPVAKGTIHCPKCHAALPAPPPGQNLTEATCGKCRGALRTITFPRVRGIDPARALSEGERSSTEDAVCRFFPELKAEKVCDACGCFLSSKAAVDHSGSVFCLPCLHARRNHAQEGALSSTEGTFVRKKMMPDQLALSLAIWGLPLSLFCSPIALYYLFRYRGPKHRGLVPRSSARWWIALVLAGAQVVFWVVMIVLWIGLLNETML